MTVRYLNPGDVVEGDGVRFRFHQDVGDLFATTTSATGDFSWRWLAMGRLATVSGDRMEACDGGLLIGDDGRIVHAIGLPASGSDHPYASAPAASVEVDLDISRGIFGREKVRSVQVFIGDDLGIGAFAVDEFRPGSASVVRKREVEFDQHFRSMGAS